MTLLLAHLAFLAIIVPLAFLIGRIIPAIKGRGPTFVLPLLLLCGALFFFLRPHESMLTGLDDMAYQLMAESFSHGTALVHEEPIHSITPPDLPADTFRFRKTGRIRPSFNRYFQVSRDNRIAVPYFEPLYPLAAAGSFLPIHLFPPLLATLWFSLLIACGFAKGGTKGSLIALLFFLSTAWPAWFLRGHFAEGAASLLVASVFLSNAVIPLRRPFELATGFFLLGLAIGIHPTAILVSAPVALSLLLFEEKGRQRLASAAGGILGLLPLFLITRHVCHPYGDWTRPAELKRIALAAAEHQALIIGTLGLALLAIAVFAGTCRPRFRSAVAELDKKLGPAGWAVLSLLPPAIIVILPGPFSAFLRRGLCSIWTGIGIPCALLWILGGWMTVKDSHAIDRDRERTCGARLLLALLCWTTPALLLVKGIETPVGLWSQRRFLPPAILLISLFASSASTLSLARLPIGLRAFFLPVLLLCCGLFNLIRNPGCYLLVNEKGTRSWRDRIAVEQETTGLLLFDYHPCSVPFTTRPGPIALGLGKHAYPQWPEIERWLADVARTGTVTIATSWTPSPVLEAHGALVPRESETAATNRFETSYPVLKTKGFFPVERHDKTVSVSLFSLLPTERLGRLAQDKFLDGSPIGLRGPWGKTRKGATWTRQGSAVIGPVTDRGTIVVTLDACWSGPPSIAAQSMTLTPPWGESGAVSFQVPADGTDGVTPPIVLEIPAPTNATARTGLYTFTSPTPYDPSKDGLRGYDDDLGVLLRRIRIETRDE